MVSLFDELEREWERLGNDRAAAAHLAEVVDIAGCARDLEDVRFWVSTTDVREADRVLVALAARAGDQLAARVLLQLLLPGARRLARRWWALGGRREREAAAVAAVFDRIRCYPLATRPRKIAANILRDAEILLRRQVVDTRRLVPLDEVVGMTAAASVPVAVHPAEELVAALREAVDAGVIGADDAHLIAATRIEGRRLADIAETRGAALRTLQTHRQRAEAALAGFGVAA
jgi:hypothetical protein